MSAQAAVFSGFQPKVQRSASQQSTQVIFLDVGSWVSEVFQALTGLEGLPPNWDSYGSPPPQASALHTARQFLAGVSAAGIPAPNVTAVPGGGIGLHWRVADRDLEIEFLPDGKAEFLKSVGADESSLEQGPLDARRDQSELWKWLGGF